MPSDLLVVDTDLHNKNQHTGFKDAASFLEWVLQLSDPMMLTWTILILLYSSDHCKTVVSENTPENISRAYFCGFDQRFEEYLCGKLEHTKESKKSVSVKLSKCPTEITLMEWLEVKRLYSSPELLL